MIPQSADADESGAVPIPEPLRPSDLADPDPGNMDSLAERGRGLYLIHRLMDAVGRPERRKGGEPRRAIRWMPANEGAAAFRDIARS